LKVGLTHAGNWQYRQQNVIVRVGSCPWINLGLRGHARLFMMPLLQYLLPLGWEHISLTGDYLWRSSSRISEACSGGYRHCNRLSLLYFPFSETTPLFDGG
jgi:hypothetical protein